MTSVHLIVLPTFKSSPHDRSAHPRDPGGQVHITRHLRLLDTSSHTRRRTNVLIWNGPNPVTTTTIPSVALTPKTARPKAARAMGKAIMPASRHEYHIHFPTGSSKSNQNAARLLSVVTCSLWPEKLFALLSWRRRNAAPDAQMTPRRIAIGIAIIVIRHMGRCLADTTFSRDPPERTRTMLKKDGVRMHVKIQTTFGETPEVFFSSGVLIEWAVYKLDDPVGERTLLWRLVVVESEKEVIWGRCMMSGWYESSGRLIL